MRKKFVFATNNSHKLEEVTAILGNESVRVYIFHHPEYFYRLAFVGKDDRLKVK